LFLLFPFADQVLPRFSIAGGVFSQNRACISIFLREKHQNEQKNLSPRGDFLPFLFLYILMDIYCALFMHSGHPGPETGRLWVPGWLGLSP
jgi:hypothetical protein